MIKNAIEAIDLNPDVKGAGIIRVSAQPIDNDQFLLVVKDNGCGIEPDKIQKIFEFGFTGKVGGSGFGLHSVATFIQSIGGSIECNSEGRGHGVAFEIRLPMKQKGPGKGG